MSRAHHFGRLGLISGLLVAALRVVASYRFSGLAVATVFAAFCQVEAATITAKSVSLADVRSAIASAGDGDTVIVPAGTASWTSALVIKKGITLQGATSIGSSSSSPAITDRTIILDDVPRGRHGEQSPKQHEGLPRERKAFVTSARPLRDKARATPKSIPSIAARRGPKPTIIEVTLTSAQSFRLTGFTFRYGALTTYANNAGVHLTGTCPSTRIDHCHFDQLYRPFITTHGQIYGVVDHCVLDERSGSLTFRVYHDGWGGRTHGDGSWTDSAYFGSEKFLFIEDNTFRNANGYKSNGIDSCGGGRYVARHNYLVDTPIGGHGTESTGRFRGVRAIEVYNNTCVWRLVEPRGQLRSGTMLQFNNVWTGKEDSRSKSTRLTCYRQFRPFPFWGGANGNNRLDSNDSHGLYASGKHTGGNGSATLVAANAGWTVNQWVGYSVTNTTQTVKGRTGAIFHPSSYITANTSDTITYLYDTSYNPKGSLTFNTGDGFAIYRLLVALDQPGRGKGELLTDKDPVATASWPHQALEPVYAWGNTYNNLRKLDVASPYPTIQENRDFYNQITPFDGTAGVGVSTLADRPKTCTPGVAYWATDEGEWDSTHEGPDGQLYVCSDRDTWSFYYKPYTYPHPLVSGMPGPRMKTTEERRQPTDSTSSSNK
jgi:hypothetical protein